MRLLHCHSTFNAGGKERRAVELMNAFGSEIEHTIVSAQPAQLGARELIDPAITAHFPSDFPSLTGRPTPKRLANLARALRDFDLILTYNWGAMDAVMARTTFASRFDLPPLVHHEDGFNADEAGELKTSRNWFRRAALRGAHSLIVPSAVLEGIARDIWHQPEGRLIRIPNGIDTQSFAAAPDPAAFPIAKREGEFWVGTLAGLRPVKQLPALVQAFNQLPDNWRLVILGEGPERARIEEAAARFGLSERVHLPGNISDPARVIGLFDIFALSSKSEQFPLSVVEAMAAGLPVAAPAVGDVADIVAAQNAPFITVPGDIRGLSKALLELANDPEKRASIGASNHARARAHFDRHAMITRYKTLYSEAMGRAL